MIDDTREIIFVHPEKSGGTSIERAFDAKIIKRNPEPALFRAGRMHAKYGVPVVIWDEQVMSASQFAIRYPDRWQNYRKIAIVRNPADRLISRHRYFLKADAALRAVAGNAIKDGIWRDLLLADIRHATNASFAPTASQAFKLGNLAEYDFILRLENIDRDWPAMIKALELEGLPHAIPHANKSGDIVQILDIVTDPADRAKLAAVLRPDLQAFGYSIGTVSRFELKAIHAAAPKMAPAINQAYNQKKPGLFRRTLQKARLGDKIAAMTNAAGIRQCGGCKRRQALLNGE